MDSAVYGAPMSIWALLSVFTLLGLFSGLSIWVQRRYARQSDGCAIAVVGHRRLDPQHAVWVVEVDGRRLLIGTGRDGTTLLTELEKAAPS